MNKKMDEKDLYLYKCVDSKNFKKEVGPFSN